MHSLQIPSCLQRRATQPHAPLGRGRQGKSYRGGGGSKARVLYFCPGQGAVKVQKQRLLGTAVPLGNESKVEREIFHVRKPMPIVLGIFPAAQECREASLRPTKTVKRKSAGIFCQSATAPRRSMPQTMSTPLQRPSLQIREVKHALSPPRLPRKGQTLRSNKVISSERTRTTENQRTTRSRVKVSTAKARRATTLCTKVMLKPALGETYSGANMGHQAGWRRRPALQEKFSIDPSWSMNFRSIPSA